MGKDYSYDSNESKLRRCKQKINIKWFVGEKKMRKVIKKGALKAPFNYLQ